MDDWLEIADKVIGQPWPECQHCALPLQRDAQEIACPRNLTGAAFSGNHFFMRQQAKVGLPA